MFVKDYHFSTPDDATRFLDGIRNMFDWDSARGYVDAWNPSVLRVSMDSADTIECIDDYYDVVNCIAEFA